MNYETFCYWLQGWFELNKTIDHREGASKETLKVIEDHLALVFSKVTPIYSEYKNPFQIDFSKGAECKTGGGLTFNQETRFC